MRLIDADSIQIPHFTLATDRIKMIDAIDEAPTIEPKRGEWMQKPHKVYLPRDCEPLFEEEYDEADHSVIRYWWHCSNCNYEADEWTRYNFCPNCGCRMKGADDE